MLLLTPAASPRTRFIQRVSMRVPWFLAAVALVLQAASISGQCIEVERTPVSASSDTVANPERVIDGVKENALWQANGAYQEDVTDCSQIHYITIDLGAVDLQTSVVLTAYNGDDRQYCSQSIELSLTGSFAGEQLVAFSCGSYAECGQSLPEGQRATLDPPFTARYVRVGQSRSTANTGTHFLEVEVDGCQALPCPFVAKRRALSATSDRFNNPGAVIDGVSDWTQWYNYGAWADLHSGAGCDQLAFVTLDLGEVDLLTAVRLFHWSGPGNQFRRYCSQAVDVSPTGDFAGEQTRVFSCSHYIDCDYASGGVPGRLIQFNPINARYVRVQSGRADTDFVIRIVEVETFGCTNSTPAPTTSTSTTGEPQTTTSPASTSTTAAATTPVPTPPAVVCSQEKLDIVSAVGIGAISNPEGVIDGVIDPSQPEDHGASASLDSCLDQVGVILDLGSPRELSAVTIYMLENPDRVSRWHCYQDVVLSLTGEFNEDPNTWAFGCFGFEQCGPVDQTTGQIRSFDPTMARYVRVRTSRGDLVHSINLLEVEVTGSVCMNNTAAPTTSTISTSGAPTTSSSTTTSTISTSGAPTTSSSTTTSAIPTTSSATATSSPTSSPTATSATTTPPPSPNPPFTRIAPVPTVVRVRRIMPDNFPLVCPPTFSMWEHTILANANYNGHEPAMFSTEILNHGSFFAVEARYNSGFISCDFSESTSTAWAWQACAETMPEVHGAAFELQINGAYVYSQPSASEPAIGCTGLDTTANTNSPVTCRGPVSIQQGDILTLGWFESLRGIDVANNAGNLTIDLVGFTCQRNLFVPPVASPCSEEDALRCHATAFCHDYGSGGVCECPEGSVGDGVSKALNGLECSRESWAVVVSMDLGQDELPELTADNSRLEFWEADRPMFADLFFRNSTVEKPSWFDTAMYHTVTDLRMVTVYALFFMQQEAESALEAFVNNTDGGTPQFAFGIRNVRLTAEPAVKTFLSRTSEAEQRVLPTGMDVTNVVFTPDCSSAGCWVIDLVYTTGEDNFNVFYIPKAIGDDTLSYDFDYTAIPAYSANFSKSPADTFLPMNFPCGSDTYTYRPDRQIPDRVSACCIDEFTKLYRPVETLERDPKIEEVIGFNRDQYCGLPTFCGDEGQICNCTGRVQYGANGRYSYLQSDGYVNCSSDVFGDPNPGTAKTCMCSPQRRIYTVDDMPRSALHGNFSGMDGLARVEFQTVEDPFAKQFRARVYLDEVALRQRAGILRGAVGVAHSIDTFIGFANFKPTGLEFLDMFAAQTLIHLEKTNFFTVSAYGENQETFLEYVNLRLVAIYEEETSHEDSYPYSFDEFHLTAEFGAYPASTAKGNSTLDDSRVWITEHPRGGYTVYYFLTGLRVGETSGGIHIHAGTSCSTHEQVLGHHYTTPDDPWTTVWEKDPASTVATGSVLVSNPGFPLADNVNHAIVVHEESGLRIACGILYPVQAGLSRTSPQNAAQYLQVTFTLGHQYQPIETGIIPIDSVLVSKGRTISEADTLQTRYHACQQFIDGSFPDLDEFSSRFPTEYAQTCAPNASMCSNPQHIPDQFVSFNVPLGIDWLPAPSNAQDAKVFIELVVSVIDSHQIAQPDSFPNQGAPAEQMKTTLTASIPVVEGGIYIFCDAITAKQDLLEVANADLVLGTAMDDQEFSRLRILENFASGASHGVRNDTYIATDSIEAGLMTLVVKGNASFFARSVQSSLEVEDIITIHVMEAVTGSKYADVLQLLRTPPQDVTTTDGFALNGAFVFTVDRSQQRAALEPTQALHALCPFTPTRPSPDDAFPSTCISRRDMRSRGFPSRDGKNATAIELPSAAVPLQGPSRNGVAAFMQSVLNPSLYSAELGRSFSHLIAQRYQLNGRYARAFWINPGYEWTPAQIGAREVFTLSQKIVIFALINLDEGFSGRRRMLLQSATGSPNPTSSTGTGQQLVFDSSPKSMMASQYDVPADLVSVFEVHLQLTEREACLDHPLLRKSLRTTLDDFVRLTASRYETVQLVSTHVDLADVRCDGDRRSLRRLRSSYSTATAVVEMMMVFAPTDSVAFDMQAFANKPGVISIFPIDVSSRVDTAPTQRQTIFKPANPVDTPAEPEPEDSQLAPPSPPPAHSTLPAGSTTQTIMFVCVGAAAVVAGVYAVHKRAIRKRSHEVEVVSTISVGDLKSDLVLP